MNFEELIRRRYSCRGFKPECIPEELIAKLKSAMISAPSACNKQPWSAVFVISVFGKSICRNAMPQKFEAPLYVILCSNRDESFIRSYDCKNFADIDSAIAGTHLMLEATNLGLASVWVGAFDSNLIKSNFPACSGKEIIGVFPVGYPLAGPGAGHFVRKQLQNLITYA